MEESSISKHQCRQIGVEHPLDPVNPPHFPLILLCYPSHPRYTLKLSIKTNSTAAEITSTTSNALSATRFALHASLPLEILSSTPQHSKAKTNSHPISALTAHHLFPDPSSNPVYTRIYTAITSNSLVTTYDYTSPARAVSAFLTNATSSLLRFLTVPCIKVETEFALIQYFNFTSPHIYHYIRVMDKRTGVVEYSRAYCGGPLWGARVVSTGEKGGRRGWSCSRWRLEAFVDVAMGRTPAFWTSGVESAWLGECVEGVLLKADIVPKQVDVDDGPEFGDMGISGES
ncbi:hypothetical protein POX_h09658 [Penicillium oxalicum]|uniref:hypothetical protein n=1 Tax=Penicillium oxalicum TaxID=69781 RepID=UPI0020B6C427|nr:hypothetical protein POX_h09658 [Penicillium oxalicum]KAI2785896.1 hypothetical protein POX_h09658 [Penicillium oxalicum]